jgi:hypothetical protein
MRDNLESCASVLQSCEMSLAGHYIKQSAQKVATSPGFEEFDIDTKITAQLHCYRWTATKIPIGDFTSILLVFPIPSSTAIFYSKGYILVC